LPFGYESFNKIVARVVAELDGNAYHYGLDKDSRSGDWYRVEFKPKYNVYTPIYEEWADLKKRTPFVTEELVAAEKELRPLFRKLCASLKDSMLVTDADLVTLGLPKRRSGKRKRAPIADLPPMFEVRPLESSRIRIYFYPESSPAKRGKPEGQSGVEVRWRFSDRTVTSPSKFTRSRFSTASPCTLEFDSGDSGKEIEIVLRWENTRGEKGPWSHIARVVIP
jgi:hypothetical protein